MIGLSGVSTVVVKSVQEGTGLELSDRHRSKDWAGCEDMHSLIGVSGLHFAALQVSKLKCRAPTFRG